MSLCLSSPLVCRDFLLWNVKAFLFYFIFFFNAGISPLMHSITLESNFNLSVPVPLNTDV